METQKYNGYDISYALIRYTIEKRGKIFLNAIIKNKFDLEQYEKEIIIETSKGLNRNKNEVDKSKNNIE